MFFKSIPSTASFGHYDIIIFSSEVIYNTNSALFRASILQTIQVYLNSKQFYVTIFFITTKCYIKVIQVE